MNKPQIAISRHKIWTTIEARLKPQNTLNSSNHIISTLCMICIRDISTILNDSLWYMNLQNYFNEPCIPQTRHITIVHVCDLIVTRSTYIPSYHDIISWYIYHPIMMISYRDIYTILNYIVTRNYIRYSQDFLGQDTNRRVCDWIWPDQHKYIQKTHTILGTTRRVHLTTFGFTRPAGSSDSTSPSEPRVPSDPRVNPTRRSNRPAGPSDPRVYPTKGSIRPA